MASSPRRAGKKAAERRDPRLVPVRNQTATSSTEMGAEAESIREQLRQTAVSMRPGTTSLIQALTDGSVEERTEAAAALEELVTCSRETAQSLAMKGACPALLKLTEEGNHAAVVAACSTLRTLASVGTNSDIIRESGGIGRLMELLPGGGAGSRDVCLAAVQALCSLLLFSSQNRVVGREKGLVRILLPMLGQPGSKTLHCEVARTLHSLSFDEEARVEIAQEGGLPAVVKGLSTAAAAWGVPLAPNSARSPGREMGTFCLGILSNLTGSSGTHQDAVDAGAVAAVASVVAATSAHATEVASQGLVILSDLASSACGRAKLRTTPGALAVLLSLLQTMEAWSRKESQAVLASKAAHVVFQLASGDELAAAHLNEAGFTRPLIGVMQMRPPKTIEASSKAGDISRAVWACVEETLNALAAMCSVPEVRERLVDKAALQSLMELLQHSDRYMKAAAHSIIQELSYSDNFTELLKSGVMAVLIEELYQYADNPDRQVDSCTLAAVSAVRNLAYDEGCVREITEANGVVPMVGILAAAPSLKAKTQAAGALNNFACHPPAVDDMFAAGVIEPVVKLLGMALEMGHSNASSACAAGTAGPRARREDVMDAITQCAGLLRNLLGDTERDDIAVAVAKGGAIPVLVPLLEQLPGEDPQALEIVVQAASALNNLSLFKPCCDTICRDAHCLPVLAKLLLTARQPRPEGTQQYWEDATLQIVSVFANLVQHAGWRERVQSSGGLRGLVALLAWEAGDVRITATLCSAVATLAGEARWKDALEKEGVVPLLVTVLRNRGVNKATLEVCTAIHNLSANSMHIKAALGPDTIPELLSLLKSKPKPPKDVQRIAGAALKTLANKYTENRNAIIAGGGADYLI
eukprot:jgi/Tetstr1/439341/TSEL_027779.t1